MKPITLMYLHELDLNVVGRKADHLTNDIKLSYAGKSTVEDIIEDSAKRTAYCQRKARKSL